MPAPSGSAAESPNRTAYKARRSTHADTTYSLVSHGNANLLSLSMNIYRDLCSQNDANIAKNIELSVASSAVIPTSGISQMASASISAAVTFFSIYDAYVK